MHHAFRKRANNHRALLRKMIINNTVFYGRRCIGCSQWQDSFRTRDTNYGALLRKTTRKNEVSYGRRRIGCPNCRTLSAKETLIIRLFCRKCYIKRRHSIHLQKASIARLLQDFSQKSHSSQISLQKSPTMSGATQPLSTNPLIIGLFCKEICDEWLFCERAL